MEREVSRMTKGLRRGADGGAITERGEADLGVEWKFCFWRIGLLRTLRYQSGAVRLPGV